jgi:hypothetical protein
MKVKPDPDLDPKRFRNSDPMPKENIFKSTNTGTVIKKMS